MFTCTGKVSKEDIPKTRLIQVNSSSSTKRENLFECVGEPLPDNDGVEGQRFTRVCMAWDQCVPSPTTGVLKQYQHRRANIVLERN